MLVPDQRICVACMINIHVFHKKSDLQVRVSVTGLFCFVYVVCVCLSLSSSFSTTLSPSLTLFLPLSLSPFPPSLLTCVCVLVSKWVREKERENTCPKVFENRKGEECDGLALQVVWETLLYFLGLCVCFCAMSIYYVCLLWIFPTLTLCNILTTKYLQLCH